MWQNATTNQFALWYTDLAGNYQSSSATMSGGTYAIQQMEQSFGQNFDSNPTIGFTHTAIDSVGTARLELIGDMYYMYQVTGSGPVGTGLRQNGDIVLCRGHCHAKEE